MVRSLTRLLGPRQATRWISSHRARAKIYRPGLRTSHLGRGFFFQPPYNAMTSQRASTGVSAMSTMISPEMASSTS